jgi:hypothetical protein
VLVWLVKCYGTGTCTEGWKNHDLRCRTGSCEGTEENYSKMKEKWLRSWSESLKHRERMQDFKILVYPTCSHILFFDF